MSSVFQKLADFTHHGSGDTASFAVKLGSRVTVGESDEMDLLHFRVLIGSRADESADISGILSVDANLEQRVAGEDLLAGCGERFLPRHTFRLGGSIRQP